jgi:oligopeptidase B
MVDGNELAKGHDFFSMSSLKVSFQQDIVAFGVDTVGRRFYTVRFKNLLSEEMLDDVIPDVTGNMAWANDNRTLFYSKQDPETLRWHRIYRHVLGTEIGDDELVYEETDETFSCYVFKTKSKRFLILGSDQTICKERRFLAADNPTGKFEIIQPREKDHEYSVVHHGDRFLIRTNWKAKNFRLMETPLDATEKDHWRELIPHRDDVFISSYDVFDEFLVVTERK